MTDQATPAKVRLTDGLGHTPRHPTLAECEEAGRGPYNCPGLPYQVGGMPDTGDERARFEAYMRGHCWEVGNYDEAARCYVSTFVRCLYGVWRDRSALPTVWPNVRVQPRAAAWRLGRVAHDKQRRHAAQAPCR